MSPKRVRIRHELRGRDLACWCPIGQPCHAELLLLIASGGDPGDPGDPDPARPEASPL